MSIKVEVVNEFVEKVKGKNGQKVGHLFHIPKLNAYAALVGERHPVGIVIDIPAPKREDDTTGHYPPGVYAVGAASFYVGKRRLQLRRHLILLPPDAPASETFLRVTVHGATTAKNEAGQLVNVADCDAHIPGEKYPVSCFIEVQDAAVPKPGEYVVGPRSFTVDYKALTLFNDVELVPFAQAPALHRDLSSSKVSPSQQAA